MTDKKGVKMEADIVIIGCGGAGLPAALTAHEKGINAVVLEKRGKVGGNALMAEGFFAAESPAQKRLLIDAKRDELFKTALDYAHYTVDPRILRVFINRSGDTVRWIEEILKGTSRGNFCFMRIGLVFEKHLTQLENMINLFPTSSWVPPSLRRLSFLSKKPDTIKCPVSCFYQCATQCPG